MSGAIVTWAQKIAVVGQEKPVARYHSGGVHYEDYQRHDGYWRYSWTNFTLDDNPEFVQVSRIDND